MEVLEIVRKDSVYDVAESLTNFRERYFSFPLRYFSKS
jgi:hypothetical protein